MKLPPIKRLHDCAPDMYRMLLRVLKWYDSPAEGQTETLRQVIMAIRRLKAAIERNGKNGR